MAVIRRNSASIDMTESHHKIIDPHLHLFNLEQGDYAWLKPHNPPFWPDKQVINKSFFETDILLQSPNQLAGFVHIEAGFDNQQPWREIDWLQKYCSLPFTSVAFADITATTFTEHIDLLKQRKSVVGIRHILDEQAAEILSSTLIQGHFSLLAEMEFSFDAQLSLTDSQAVERLIALANKHKAMRIIINHAGWAPAENNVYARKQWKLNLSKIAKCENIAIKLSGWEMSSRTWNPQHSATVIQDCLALLGETRVMLASNFPLCLFSMSYTDLWNTYAELSGISAQCFEKITFSNAKSWYRLH
ncbi:amidohydrolase [Paraglaciecola sp. MB-3u-78]|jgi:L-fuconolactonase|uniref:amidohydrolase family protein n=1 Tax=Paraglaciecola sp. MB-3u-78 TaxID=2058332 RepID=UPI000C31D908|nr:amidohydrolase family protein [Paraglaciecola sp. MB-3u-78]PKG97100.1 amidohydrolase [Paraglaciecola sp. MB-3u-78]